MTPTVNTLAKELELALGVLAEDPGSTVSTAEVWSFLPADRSNRRKADDPGYVYVRKGAKTLCLTVQVLND